MRAAEVFEVLPARHDHRMIGRKRRRSYGRRPAIKTLRLTPASRSFGDDREVVQGIGEIRVERAELFFLNARGAAQQLTGRRKVARRSSVFRPLENVTSLLLFSHRVPASNCDSGAIRRSR